jgi:hypothetical protein
MPFSLLLKTPQRACMPERQWLPYLGCSIIRAKVVLTQVLLRFPRLGMLHYIP